MKRVLTHQYDVDYAIEHTRALDNEFAAGMIGREAPNDLICPNQDVIRIGNLCDMAHVRKVDLSFNPIDDLMGLDQLPQLRELRAYCCKLVELEFLEGTPRIERLVVHQNKILGLPLCLAKCSKLRELRADKNRIANIKHIQGCAALRILNLSWNNLSSIEGIAGLQNLQELRLSNNSLKSLKPLKGLPSLTELDVVANQLRSLDGIQQVPTLETVHAEHNALTTVRVPLAQTHTGKVQVPRAVTGASMDDDALMAGKAPSGAPSSTEMAHGMPHLVELYVSSNKISSLANMDSLGHGLEVLDLSNNVLGDALGVVGALKPLHKLSELRVAGNPCVQEGMLHGMAESLARECRVLRMVDDLVIVGGKVIGLGEGPSSATPAFNTWEGAQEEEETVERPLSARSSVQDGTEKELEDELSDSDIDDEYLQDPTVGTFRQRGEPIPDPNVHQDEGRNAPRINLEHVLSKEEVNAMEGEFKGLIDGTIARIELAVRELEKVDDPDEEALPERTPAEQAVLEVEEQLAAEYALQAVAVEKEQAEEEALRKEELEVQMELERAALEQANVKKKQTETEYAAERIRQILRSRVPIRPEKQMAALAALPGGGKFGAGGSKPSTGNKRRKAGTKELRNGREPMSNAEKASRQAARRSALADEVAKLAAEFAAPSPTESPVPSASPSRATSAGEERSQPLPDSPQHSTTSLRSTASQRSSKSVRSAITGQDIDKKYKNGLLGDGGPQGHSSGLSKFGSRVKKTHFGTAAPGGSKHGSGASTVDPFNFDEIDRLSTDIAKGSSAVGVGPLSETLGRFDDPDAVQQAQRLLEPGSHKSLLQMGMTSSPTNLQDALMKQSPSPPRNEPAARGSPRSPNHIMRLSGQQFAAMLPPSPINTARRLEEGGGSDDPDGYTGPAFNSEAEAEARLLARRQGRGSGFNAFSGLMSQVADPRFANKNRGLALGEGDDDDKRETGLERSESMPSAASVNNKHHLHLHLNSGSPGKENGAMNNFGAGLMPASGSDSKLIMHGFATDMNDDDEDDISNHSMLSSHQLSGRRVTSAKRERPLSAGRPAFKIPDDARDVLRRRKDGDAPVDDYLTELSVATVDTLDVMDVHAYDA